MLKMRDDFIGGNVRVKAIDGDTVHPENEL